MTPTQKTPSKDIFAPVLIFNVQIVCTGSARMVTSVMALKAPMAMNEAFWLPHVPGTVGSYELAKGRQMRKICIMFPILHRRTHIIVILVAIFIVRLTKILL